MLTLLLARQPALWPLDCHIVDWLHWAPLPPVKSTALVFQNIPPDVQARAKDELTLWVVAAMTMAGIPAFSTSGVSS